MIGLMTLAAGLLALAGSSFSDNFDSYTANTTTHNYNGWHGWDNASSAEAVVSTSYARSAANSVDCGGTADLVQTFTPTSGRWTLKVWQYVPSSATGSTYVILMNTYVDNGAKGWSTQLYFDFSANLVYDNMGGASGSGALVKDRWVPIVIDIDLDAKTQTIFYNNTKVTTVGWNRMGGPASFAAVDLYGNTATHVYYDDFTLGLTSTTVPVKVTRWREVSSDQ